jgi:phosphoglycolate phosphatase-like HAD superfamily hydrolase
MPSPLIALDADGVLLDYNQAYASAWERAFGKPPGLRNPQAYWAVDRWHVERLTGDALGQFRACFDEKFWRTIPPIDGAVEACRDLVRMGYSLVCVTALGPDFAEARARNLRAHGFPIDRLISTSNHAGARSPKADAIDRLNPVAFVDDYLPYHLGIAPHVHKALILREPEGSPNVGPDLASVDSQHPDLRAFAASWPALRR